MRSHQLTWQGLLGLGLAAVALSLLPGVALAQAAVTVQLDPVGDSGVGGTATLTAAGAATTVVLEIQGLAPGSSARATMHAGTCAMPSASFAAMPDLTADETGNATATGSVLFRGAEDVALVTMADGEHIIVIQSEQVVACGVIPRLGAAASPAELPVTGGRGSLLAGVAALVGSCALSLGLLGVQRLRRCPSSGDDGLHGGCHDYEHRR